MKTDRILKTALPSLIFNIVYAVYNAVIGFSYSSWWYITLFSYYIILSVMRFSILRIKQKSCGDISLEVFARKFTGIMLILLSIILFGVMILSSVTDRGIKQHEILMISTALYAFTKLTIAIINLIKANKNKETITITLRNISFCDAFVSIFSLQRSMLVSFPGMAEKDIQLFNIFTGSAVCILVFLFGINLIGGKRINMAKSKIIEANEKIADTVVSGYKKIETAVVDGYTKIEDAVTEGYSKIEDKFVEKYLAHDGETIMEAKERLKKK